MTHNTTDWRDRAACRDEDPELFFPVSDVGPGARQTAEAKTVCGRCPVRRECLDFALDNGLDYGIFGGTTERERREIKVARRSSDAAEAA